MLHNQNKIAAVAAAQIEIHENPISAKATVLKEVS